MPTIDDDTLLDRGYPQWPAARAGTSHSRFWEVPRQVIRCAVEEASWKSALEAIREKPQQPRRDTETGEGQKGDEWPQPLAFGSGGVRWTGCDSGATQSGTRMEGGALEIRARN